MACVMILLFPRFLTVAGEVDTQECGSDFPWSEMCKLPFKVKQFDISEALKLIHDPNGFQQEQFMSVYIHRILTKIEDLDEDEPCGSDFPWSEICKLPFKVKNIKSTAAIPRMLPGSGKVPQGRFMETFLKTHLAEVHTYGQSRDAAWNNQGKPYERRHCGNDFPWSELCKLPFSVYEYNMADAVQLMLPGPSKVPEQEFMKTYFEIQKMKVSRRNCGSDFPWSEMCKHQLFRIKQYYIKDIQKLWIEGNILIGPKVLPEQVMFVYLDMQLKKSEEWQNDQCGSDFPWSEMCKLPFTIKEYDMAVVLQLIASGQNKVPQQEFMQHYWKSITAENTGNKGLEDKQLRRSRKDCGSDFPWNQICKLNCIFSIDKFDTSIALPLRTPGSTKVSDEEFPEKYVEKSTIIATMIMLFLFGIILLIVGSYTKTMKTHSIVVSFQQECTDGGVEKWYPVKSRASTARIKHVYVPDMVVEKTDDEAEVSCCKYEEVVREMSKDSKIDLSTDCAWQACDVAKQDFDDVEKSSDFIDLDNRELASDVAKQEFDEDQGTMADEVLPEGQSSESMSQSEGQLETVTITDKFPAHDIPYNDTLRKVSVEICPKCFNLPQISMVKETYRRFCRQYTSLDLLDDVLLPPKLHHLSSIFGSAEFHRSLSMARLFLEPLVEKEVATGIIMKELKFYTPKQTGEQYKLEKHSQMYFKRIEKTSLKPKLFSDLVMMENYEHLLSPSFENDVTNPLYVPAKMLRGNERIQGPLSPSIDTQENEGYTYHLKLMENEDLSEDTETVDDLITGPSICLQDNEQESRLMPRTEIENAEELDRKVALNRRTMATEGLKPHVSQIRVNTWIPLEDLPKPTLDHVIVAPNPDSRIDMTLEEIFESIGQRLVPGPKTTMRYEFLRLCTMKTFPSINKPFIIRLVATGFYYASVRDELTCYCCGIRNSNWQATDNPEGIHRNRSPRCKFFLRNQEVNVRIPEPSGPQSENLQRLEHLQQISSNPERATTSLPATAPERQLPTTEGTGHIAGGRAVRSPGAAGLQSDETVPTTTVQAKYPHYATKSARLESFKGWPQSLTQTPDIMAEAGFYFAGFGDCCRCFQCGVGLRHWDIDDNPWVEHCRWSSSCLYLKLKKGEEFVRLVQMAVTVTQEAPETLINRQLNGRSTLEEERSESGTPAPPQLSEVNTLLLTDAAQSVLEMGYQPKIIKQAIGKILQTKGRTGITAVALMEEVMELEEKEKQENATQNNSNNTVVLKSGGSTDQEEITLLVSDFSANTEGETNATASTDDSTLDSKAIKSENERLREQTLCKICLVNSICVVFLPCGHLVTCVDCAPAMRKCPMCRQIVKGTVRTYMG